MITSSNSKWLGTLFFCALAIAACGDSRDTGDGPSASTTGAGRSALRADGSVLRYIPADTPYVLANTAPLPDALLDKIEPKIDSLLESYHTVLRETYRSRTEEISDAGNGDEERQRITAIIDELSSLFSVEGIRGAGIGRESTIALYGHGLLPVLRIQLTDGKLFEAAIARIEEQAGQKLAVAELDGNSYRYIDADEARIVIATFGDQAVFTVAPSVLDDEKLGLLLGLTLPVNNIDESGQLQKLAKEFGFTEHFVGLISPERIAATFLDDPSGLNADILALMDYNASTLSDVCKSEIRAAVAVAPRMILGYTEINEDKVDSSMIIELRDDIAAGLALLPAAVPGLGIDHGGLMSFGMSVNPKAARDFYEARLDAMETDPFKCELFQELQAGVAKGRQALNQPLPPIVYDFKGFLAVVDDIEGLDLTSNAPPTSISARFLLAIENAQALVALGSMFSPDLAGLNLQADQKPVAFDVPQMNGGIENVFVAMSENALAMSAGDGAETKLAGMFTATAPKSPPFVSVVIDSERYYSLIGDTLAASDDADDAQPEAVKAALQNIMKVGGSMYERLAMDVSFSSRGIEIDSSMTIGD